MGLNNVNWDHLRLFLAVVRAQSAQEAARRLGIDHSTVTRRLHRLEQQLGTQLFERTPGGHRLNPAGHRLLEHVERIESSVATLGEEVGGESGQLTGQVRLGATEGFGGFFLPPLLGAFTQQHPQIRVDLLIVPRFINLSQREADVAINVERPPSAGQVSAKLCDYRLRLYAHRQYLARHAPMRSLADLPAHPLLGYVDELAFSPELRYLESIAPRLHTPLRSTSIVAQFAAVRAGHGLGVLPCFLAAECAELVPVLPHSVDLVRTFWIAAPQERRELARVRALWNHLREAVQQHQAALMGEPA